MHTYCQYTILLFFILKNNLAIELK